MISIHDVMVGDYLQNTNGNVGKVVGIRNYAGTDPTLQGAYEVVMQYHENSLCYSDPKMLQPIPITPEILEKNGFEKLDFSHFQIGDRRLVLDADGRWDGPLSWHWVVTEMDTNAKGQPVVLDYYVATINYVHELQHALRICGIEKEIVL